MRIAGFPSRLPGLLLVLSQAWMIAIAPDAAHSLSLVNGDFETGDFTGWLLETDGKPGQANDFSIVPSGGGSAARIEADYYATQGDVTSAAQDAVFIANTLHQPLDLSVQPGETIELRLDWTFGGEDGAASAGEVFLVGLADATGKMFGVDGQPGYVRAPVRSYGSGSVGVVLEPTVFNDASGWSLEVQILVGVDSAGKQHNALGSYVEIDNVLLPEPSGVAGLGAGTVLIFALRRRRRGSRSATAANLAVALAVLFGMAQATPAQAWTDASGSAALTTNPKALDRSADVLFSYAEVTNTSGGALDDLRLVVTLPSVPVTNQDGWTGVAESFFDVPALADGESATVRIEFPLARVHVDYGLRLETLLPPATALAITTPASLTMDPVGQTPLAGLITATTNVPARVTLTATSTSGSFMVEFHEYNTDHSLPLLGLRTASSYTVDLTFTDSDDNSVSSSSLVAVTGALPVDAPDIDVMVNVPAQKEPGYTWLDPAGGFGAYALVFDQDAEIVWYSTMAAGGTRKLENGNLQWLTFSSQAVEADLLGNVISTTSMQLPALPEARLHHELFPTLYGTFVSMDREHVLVDDVPTSTTDPNAPTATKLMIDEPLVEFLADGTPLKRWPLVDIIDATRVNWESETFEPIDWAHTNSIVHDPRDDSLIVSVRHQDCVIKVDRVTGQLKWILGNPSNWTPAFDAFRLQPVGTVDWQYHEHAVMVAPNGNLVLFDNGNNRASPFDPLPPLPDADNESRAVEFAVDEENMEVTQVWEWKEDFADRIYSRFISDADALPQTGNVLIDFGGTTHQGGIDNPTLGYGTNVIRLIEVTNATPGVVVMDILLSDPVDSIIAYRAEHWSSLYPPDATRTDL